MSEKNISIIDYAGQKAGMDYYTMSLAKAISKNKIKVFVYSNYIIKNAEGVHTIKVFKLETKNVFSKIFDSIFGIFKSAFLAKLNRSDYVIMHLFSSSLFAFFQFFICRLFNKRIVTIVHDVQGFKSEAKMVRSLIINNFSWKLVVHNKFSEEQILKSGLVNDLSKIYRIKHGGFLEKSNFQNKISRSNALKDFGLDAGTNYILFFGQISSAKGLDILLKSLKYTKSKFKLIIAGRVIRNSSFEPYQKIIDDIGVNQKVIKLLRFIEDDEMHKLFALAGMMILPYKRSYQSGALLMAMSNGIPVLVSDISPMKEIIKHKENGLIFKSEDEYDLANQIDSFLENIDEQYNSFSLNAIDTISNHYSWDLIAKKYISNFNKLNF